MRSSRYACMSAYMCTHSSTVHGDTVEHIYIQTYACMFSAFVQMRTYIRLIYICVYMCVCVHTYIHICTYIHTHILTHSSIFLYITPTTKCAVSDGFYTHKYTQVHTHMHACMHTFAAAPGARQLPVRGAETAPPPARVSHGAHGQEHSFEQLSHFTAFTPRNRDYPTPVAVRDERRDG